MSDGGKGDKRRPEDQQKFSEGFDRIFGKKKMEMSGTMGGAKIVLPEHYDEEYKTSWGGPNCDCHKCRGDKIQTIRKELDLDSTTMTAELFERINNEVQVKMVLCPICGNKRCPKASDHRLDCTNSNDVGQTGSVY